MTDDVSRPFLQVVARLGQAVRPARLANPGSGRLAVCLATPSLIASPVALT
jgi:hypothetical protein